MKKMITTVVLIIIANTVLAQDKWFKTYSDSVVLMKDANNIAKQFTKDIKKIKPDSKLNVQLILNTTPTLIYIERDTIHLPLWDQVIPEIKQYLTQLSGSQENAKEVFGLYFNGFYLPHELAHGFQFTIQKRHDLNEYNMEYFANTVSILWWRKQKREADLKRCYECAKKIMKEYPNPFPKGVNEKIYFSEKYDEIQKDMELFARIYPYIQFNQFIEIYEDKSLQDFNTFIKNHIDNNLKINH